MPPARARARSPIAEILSWRGGALCLTGQTGLLEVIVVFANDEGGCARYSTMFRQQRRFEISKMPFFFLVRGILFSLSVIVIEDNARRCSVL